MSTSEKLTIGEAVKDRGSVAEASRALKCSLSSMYGYVHGRLWPSAPMWVRLQDYDSRISIEKSWRYFRMQEAGRAAG